MQPAKTNESSYSVLRPSRRDGEGVPFGAHATRRGVESFLRRTRWVPPLSRRIETCTCLGLTTDGRRHLKFSKPLFGPCCPPCGRLSLSRCRLMYDTSLSGDHSRLGTGESAGPPLTETSLTSTGSAQRNRSRTNPRCQVSTRRSVQVHASTA